MASKVETPNIPRTLYPFFQEYDPAELDIHRDADLIIQRTLEYGAWDDVRWLLSQYGVDRIRKFIRLHGERLLRPACFNYWRKLLKVHRWKHTPFPTPKGELWPL